MARLSELNKILKKKAEEEEKASDEDIGSWILPLFFLTTEKSCFFDEFGAILTNFFCSNFA